jgi:hypothetical protein
MSVVRAVVPPVWNAVKSIITSVMNAVKSVVGRVWPAITNTIKTAVGAIKTAITGIRSVIGTVTNAFNSIKSAMTKPIETARNTISGVVSKIKGFFPIRLGHIINLQVPKITLQTSTKSVLGKSITYPSGFNISWHEKAMENPYLFDRATLFGAGEAGDEMLYGRKALMDDIREATSGQNVTINNYITVDGAEDPEDFADRFVRKLEREVNMAYG